MDVFRTPDERFESLPGYDFASRYVEVDGLRMHYIDEGPPGARPIVCFHGEPTWAYLYRKLLAPLVEAGHRVVCPDFVGFGRSDKPTELGWYTYDRHVEQVCGLLASLDLKKATVVVQDWGGPIGLRWADENPERVARLVLLNTALFGGEGKPSEGFLAWRAFAERNPDLPVGFVIQSGTATDLPQQVLDAYEAPFPTVASKAGAAQFPLIVPLGEDDPGAAEMRAIRARLGSFEKPALVCFSDSDPVFRPSVGQRFVDLIPTAEELVVIEGASHFLQEDRGAEIAAEIVRFLGRRR